MVLAGPATAPGRPTAGADAPIGPLVLRIRGTSRDGQLVRIRSRRCTIGSAPDCTLRLDAFGVGPLHCLVVRGRRTTLVRRWGPDTLLNGAAFSDAELRPGDRLRVGPIELEVVQTTATPRPTQACQPANLRETPEFIQLSRRLQIAKRQGHQRARRALAALRTARQEVARLESLHQDALATRSPAALEADVHKLRTEHEAVEKDRKRLDAAVAAFQNTQKQWQAQQESEKSETTALRGQLETAQAEWNARREALLKEQEDWARKRKADETVLRRQQEELDARQAKLDAQPRKAESDARRDGFLQEQERWAKKRETEEASLHRRQEELAARQARLDAQLKEATQTDARRKELHEEQERWAQKRETEETGLRRRQEALDARQTEETGLRRRQEALDARQAELDAQLKEAARTDARGKELHEEQERWAKKRETEEAGLRRRQEALDARQAELDAQLKEAEGQQRRCEADASEIQVQREAFQAEQQQWNAIQQAREERLRQEEAAWQEARQSREQVAAGPELPSSKPAGPAPTDVQEVLARLGTVSLVPDDENESPPPLGNTAAASDAKPAANPSAAGRASSRAAEDGDESIDSYMARLMQRVRAVAGQPSAGEPTAPAPPQPRAARKVDVAPPADAPPQAAQGPVDLSPRRFAPEDVARLSAMRQLASGAAYSALDQHARKMLRRAIRDKLLITIVATLCGVGLVTGWSLWRLGNVSYYAGLVCILLAVVWGTQYAILTGRLMLRRGRKNPWVELLEAAVAESQPVSEESDPTAAPESGGLPH